MSAAQNRLLEVTAGHIRLLTELDRVLEEESEALGQRQLTALQSSTDRKNDLLAQIESMGKELSQLCREAGLQPKATGLANMHVTSVMAEAWLRMCALIERCEQQNRINGVAINASRNFAENLLALLQGHPPTQTYGRTGAVYRDSSAKALGSA